MKNLISDLSQQKAVTVARIMYPIWMIVGYFGLQYEQSTFIVSGNASETANKIMANETMYRLSIVAGLLEPIIFVLAALVLYQLFKSVSKNHASLMLVFVLISAPITIISTLNHVAALLVLNGADYLKVFDTAQLQALSMLFLNIYDKGIAIATIFWGLWLFPLGYLVYKSGYFPKFIGVLLTIAGFGFLLNPIAQLLLPVYQTTLISISDVLTLGEVLFIAWLLFMGAKVPIENIKKGV